MTRTKQRHRHGGFTLIELLVALSILAVMALLSWRGLDGMMRAQERTQAHANALSRLGSALEQWQADLDALENTRRQPVLHFNGQTLRLTRRDVNPQSPATRVVAWSYRAGEAEQKGQWLRWQSAALHTAGEVDQAWAQAALWASNPSSQAQQQEIALVEASRWQIFFYRSDAWVNPQSDASSGGAVSAVVPDGVRLMLDLNMSDGLTGTLTRDWVRPTLGGGKS
jgi:general secretion pathway protein J